MHDLTYDIRVGYIHSNRQRKIFYPPKISNIQNQQPHGSLSMNLLNQFSIYQTLKYRHTFNNVHNITIMAGYSGSLHKNLTTSITGKNFPNGLVSTFNAAQITDASSLKSDWSLLSYIGRIIYNYNNRYIINFNFRRDGSSRFGSLRRWGIFPSVSAAWRIANEKFFHSNIISSFKLRAGWGETGNNEIGDYASIPQMNLVYAAFGSDGSLSSGYTPVTIPNKELSWEKNKSINAGLNMSFLNNRVSLKLGAYRKLTTNLLMNVRIPVHTGFSSQLLNTGKVLNKGLNIHITSINMRGRTGSLRWITDGNIGINHNEVKALGPNNTQILTGAPWGDYSLTKVGHPIGSFYLLHTIGVWNTKKEIESNPHWEGTIPGDPRLQDWNGDGKVDIHDRHLIGSPIPKYTFGIQNTIQYKDVNFSFLFVGSGGNEFINAPSMRPPGSADQSHTEHYAYFKHFWRGPNKPYNKLAPRPDDHITGAVGQLSDRGLFSGNYIILRNITLGYTLPSKFTSKGNLKSVKIFFNVKNLWIHDHAPYTYNVQGRAEGGNPLAGGGSAYVNYPLAKKYIIGVDVSF
jgi:TonB-linked SusC/RagA family outer membrane protein